MAGASRPARLGILAAGRRQHPQAGRPRYDVVTGPGSRGSRRRERLKWRRIRARRIINAYKHEEARGDFSPRRQAGAEEMLIDLAGWNASITSASPTWPTPDNWSASAPAAIAARRCDGTFTEAHILAITQAICDYRAAQGIDGPLFMGKDTHALSGPAQRTALEVLAANGVETVIQRDDGFTPTPVISHAILVYNRGRKTALADGIVITPSHNPPEDGGFKYNPPNGGPADTRRHQLDPGSRQRTAARRAMPSVKRMPLRHGAQGGDHDTSTISCCPTSTIWRMWSTWRRFATRV